MLAVNDIITKRLKNSSDVCKICDVESETIEHMIFRCPKAQILWKICPIKCLNIENIGDFARSWKELFDNINQYPISIELIKLSISIL